MGEHRLQPYGTLKARWEISKQLSPKQRYLRYASEGTFKYPEGLYGPMSRREYKDIRKWLKKTLNGYERRQVLYNLMGRDDL